MDIRAEEISFQYGDSEDSPLVLDGVSFTLEGGECAALAGPSGSGKSTLAQLLNGLLSPTRGRLLADDRPYSDNSRFLRDLRRKVALVFQFPEAQIFEATVADEVAYAARQQGILETEIPARVDSALDAVGLNPAAFRDRNPLKLSGGEDRLVTIASLLVVDPDLLILDEPTLGLDYPHKLMIQALIENRRRGQGVLLITHDLDLALALCPRSLVLNKGCLAWDGPTRELFLEHDPSAEFGLADPESVQVWKRIRTALPDIHVPGPLELETWVAGLAGPVKRQVMNLIGAMISGG
jgi:energy-coupling factor transport system ATP-binding protein